MQPLAPVVDKSDEVLVQAKQRPKALEGLPPFPPVARRLMDLVAREDCHIQEVSRLIRTDACFAAEVLRLANSAIFGLRYEVVSILHAISVLGLDRLKAMVITVGMRKFMSAARTAVILRQCWRHNLASALASEWLAGPCRMDKSVAYTGGLLHDVGRLALITLHADRYRELVVEVETAGIDPGQAERAAFEIDSQQAGLWVGQEWGLPPQLFDVLSTRSARGDGTEFTLPSLVAVACQLADWAGFGIATCTRCLSPDDLRWHLPPDAWRIVEPRLTEFWEILPFKINLFESEFLFAA